MNTASIFTASMIACLSSTGLASAAEPAKSKTTQTTAAAFPAGPSSADAPLATASAEAPDKHLRGLELIIRPSFGGAGSGSPIRYAPTGGSTLQGDPGSVFAGTSSPYGGGFVGQAMIGYRAHPLISAGIRGGIRSASASAVNDGSSGLTRTSWDAGFYARAYPLALSPSISKHLDPWVGVGVEYMRDTQAFKRSLQNVSNVDFSLDHHAVAVPLGIGVDYRVLPLLSVGPSFEYALASSIAGCIKASAPGATSSFCSNEEPGKQFVKSESYGVWTAGLDVRATF